VSGIAGLMQKIPGSRKTVICLSCRSQDLVEPQRCDFMRVVNVRLALSAAVLVL